ncbi:MAG: ribbon-helix-helix protein, CopG family [Spirochaetia bacterium]|jgi:metal-responsive CopG/Arc/MetJ family transcriptional regulator
MKVKTSITLSRELISQIDEISAGEKNRSAFIETAVAAYIELLQRAKRDQNDLGILNRLSPRLNREMKDSLKYQAEI